MSHLDIESPLFKSKPHGWIQWKGTEICIDLHCKCGAALHYDGGFFYYWRCENCGQVWEMGTHVSMYEVPPEHSAIELQEPEIWYCPDKPD